MNAIECCRTIGCNCAGTIGMEILSNPIKICIILFLAAVFMFILSFIYVWYKKRSLL